MAIWQDLVDGHGFGEKYASVKRFVRKLRGSSTPEARVVIETAPGEEAQVDYGTGPMGCTRKLQSNLPHAIVRPDVGIQPESCSAFGFRSSSRVWASRMRKLFAAGWSHSCGGAR